MVTSFVYLGLSIGSLPIDCSIANLFFSEILFKSWADKVLRLFYLASLHFPLPATIVPFLTCCVLEKKLDCLWSFICMASLSSEGGRLATCQWLSLINRYLSSAQSKFALCINLYLKILRIHLYFMATVV